MTHTGDGRPGRQGRTAAAIALGIGLVLGAPALAFGASAGSAGAAGGDGQLGDGGHGHHAKPVRVHLPANVTVIGIGAGPDALDGFAIVRKVN